MKKISNVQFGIFIHSKVFGTNGYPKILFRKFWSIVKDRVIKFVKKVFRLGSVHFDINITFLVLILEVERVVNFFNFRPISLSNFVYKNTAKLFMEKAQKGHWKYYFSTIMGFR